MPKTTKSCILLRQKETGEWLYSARTTTVEETKAELKEGGFGELYSYHGIFPGWIQAAEVAQKIHEQEVAQRAGANFNEIYRNIYD